MLNHQRLLNFTVCSWMCMCTLYRSFWSGSIIQHYSRGKRWAISCEWWLNLFPSLSYNTTGCVLFIQCYVLLIQLCSALGVTVWFRCVPYLVPCLADSNSKGSESLPSEGQTLSLLWGGQILWVLVLMNCSVVVLCRFAYQSSGLAQTDSMAGVVTSLIFVSASLRS